MEIKELIAQSNLFDVLKDIILNGAKLNYDGESLIVGSDMAIMAFIQAVDPVAYWARIEYLQKEREKKNV